MIEIFFYLNARLLEQETHNLYEKFAKPGGITEGTYRTLFNKNMLEGQPEQNQGIFDRAVAFRRNPETTASMAEPLDHKFAKMRTTVEQIRQQIVELVAQIETFRNKTADFVRFQGQAARKAAELTQALRGEYVAPARGRSENPAWAHQGAEMRSRSAGVFAGLDASLAQAKPMHTLSPAEEQALQERTQVVQKWETEKQRELKASQEAQRLQEPGYVQHDKTQTIMAKSPASIAAIERDRQNAQQTRAAETSTFDKPALRSQSAPRLKPSEESAPTWAATEAKRKQREDEAAQIDRSTGFVRKGPEITQAAQDIASAERLRALADAEAARQAALAQSRPAAPHDEGRLVLETEGKGQGASMIRRGSTTSSAPRAT